MFLNSGKSISAYKNLFFKIIIIMALISAALLIIPPLSSAANHSAAENSSEENIYIEAEDLNNRLAEKNKIKIIDLRSSLKYSLGHLPGAVHLRSEEMRAQLGWVEELIPEAHFFTQIMREKGINQDSEIIIYGEKNSPRTARLYFIFKFYQHHNLKILKGGYQSWQENDFQKKLLPFKAKKGNFIIKDVNNQLLVTTDTIAENLGKQDFLVLDLRSKSEFKGQKKAASAPRKGRIPASINLAWTEFFDQQHNLKTKEELRAILKQKSISPDQSAVVLLSNKGIKAAQIFLVLESLGYQNLKLYDGGWLAWSSRSELPLAAD